MNYFHLEAKIISRGAGRSVIAAAAYASCSKLYNDYDGITHDYTKKQGCLYSEIFLPEYAPAEWKDRQTLWKAVETVEKTKDSRLARELIVALPIELSLSDWKSMLKQFICEQATTLGMCADVNIHDTDGHNPHAHILLTMRPLDTDGTWQAKTQKEYLCKRGNEECGFTADEFKIAKIQGWEKQYSYQIGKKKIYLTPSEAEKIENSIRVSKTPKSTRYGRQNPIVAHWNSEEQLLTWRKSWENIVNEEQRRHNILEYVDCRSHAARGKTEQPTIHEGYHARNLESMGLLSERCELNRQIKADNKNLNELKKELQKLLQSKENNISSIANTLESLREHMVLLQYQLLFNRKQHAELTYQKNLLSNILKEHDKVKETLKAKTKKRKTLIIEKKACGIHFIHANKLQEQITTLTEEIEELKNHKSQLLFRLDCQENELASKKQILKITESSLEKLEAQHNTLSKQKEAYKKQFLEMKYTISGENKDAVQEARKSIRFDYRNKSAKKLLEIYQKKYSYDTFEEANQWIDKELQEASISTKKSSVKEYLKMSNQEISTEEKQQNKCRENICIDTLHF